MKICHHLFSQFCLGLLDFTPLFLRAAFLQYKLFTDIYNPLGLCAKY